MNTAVTAQQPAPLAATIVLRSPATLSTMEAVRQSSITVTCDLRPQPEALQKVSYIASAPIERRASFSGSALPFANEAQAFHRTPNRGAVAAGSDGSITVTLTPPGAYYAGLGSVLVHPALHVFYRVGSDRYHGVVKLFDALPYRMLTYPASRISAAFYDVKGLNQRIARSQAAILAASAYPTTDNDKDCCSDASPKTFWNQRPPL